MMSISEELHKELEQERKRARADAGMFVGSVAVKTPSFHFGASLRVNHQPLTSLSSIVTEVTQATHATLYYAPLSQHHL